MQEGWEELAQEQEPKADVGPPHCSPPRHRRGPERERRRERGVREKRRRRRKQKGRGEAEKEKEEEDQVRG